MSRRLFAVMVLPLLIGAAVAIPAALALGPNQWAFAAIGFGLCVPPGLAVLLLHDYLARTSLFGKVMSMFAGTLIRLVVCLGGGVAAFLLANLEEKADKIGFLVWILFAYLTTLVIETVVFAKPRSASQ